MRVRDLVNATVKKQISMAAPAEKGEVRAVSTTTTDVEAKTPTFLTPQTLVTFPGATLGITAVVKLAERLFPALQGHDWPTAVVGALVGIFIAWLSVTDEKVTLPRDKTILIVVGFFNTVFLIASALGIQVLVTSPGVGGGTPPTNGTTTG